MNPVRREKIMLRFSVFTASLFAAFWGIWYYIAGEIPMGLYPEWFSLDIPLSRWTDVLAGPIYTVMVVMALSIYKDKDRQDKVSPLDGPLCIATFCGICLGACIGLLYSLIFGLALALFIFSSITLVGGLIVALIKLIPQFSRWLVAAEQQA